MFEAVDAHRAAVAVSLGFDDESFDAFFEEDVAGDSDAFGLFVPAWCAVDEDVGFVVPVSDWVVRHDASRLS